jgi:hypothetical protein
MQNHYAIKEMGITIYDFHADNDHAATKIAKDRFTDYELLVCVTKDGIKIIGGRSV